MKVQIIKCHKPKMTDHRGRTWDTMPIILPDGTKTDGYLDTTWGYYIYFVIDNQWYKVSLDGFTEDTIDLRN